jgi:hypothetical protein
MAYSAANTGIVRVRIRWDLEAMAVVKRDRMLGLGKWILPVQGIHASKEM